MAPAEKVLQVTGKTRRLAIKGSLPRNLNPPLGTNSDPQSEPKSPKSVPKAFRRQGCKKKEMQKNDQESDSTNEVFRVSDVVQTW